MSIPHFFKVSNPNHSLSSDKDFFNIEFFFFNLKITFHFIY